jgi:hypothetical protein
MGLKRKHIPQRMCVVCRSVSAKRQLTRVVRAPGGGIQLDPTGKLPGRGAYLCDNPACWAQAARSAVLNKALRTELTDEERNMIAAHGVRLAPDAET